MTRCACPARRVKGEATISRLNALLDRIFPLYIIGIIAVGFTFDGIGPALSPCTSLMLATQMFLMALSVRFTQVWQALRTPRYLLLWGACAWGFAPAFSFFLGKMLLSGSPEFAAGLVLSTSLPAAVTANVWTGISGGNLPLALTIVSAASLLSGIVTPLLLSGWVGVLVDLDAWGLLRGLVLSVMIPTLIGVAVNEVWHERLDPVRPATRLCVKLLVGLVMFVNASVLQPQLHSWGWSALGILALVVFQAAFLYVLVLALSRRLFGLGESEAIALTYTTAMRNNSAGIVIGMTYFGPTVAAPVILSILVQQPLASLVHRLLFAERQAGEKTSRTRECRKWPALSQKPK